MLTFLPGKGQPLSHALRSLICMQWGLCQVLFFSAQRRTTHWSTHLALRHVQDTSPATPWTPADTDSAGCFPASAYLPGGAPLSLFPKPQNRSTTPYFFALPDSRSKYFIAYLGILWCQHEAGHTVPARTIWALKPKFPSCARQARQGIWVPTRLFLCSWLLSVSLPFLYPHTSWCYTQMTVFLQSIGDFLCIAPDVSKTGFMYKTQMRLAPLIIWFIELTIIITVESHVCVKQIQGLMLYSICLTALTIRLRLLEKAASFFFFSVFFCGTENWVQGLSTELYWPVSLILFRFWNRVSVSH